MTHEEFVEWINERISRYRMCEKDLTAKDSTRRICLEVASQLEDVKEKFFTLTPPPTTLS